MTKSKFTSGPWGFQESEAYKNTWRITADGQRLASLDSDDGDPAQTQANAELMADAPRLLEVLRKVLEYSHIDQSWLTLDEAEQAHTEAYKLLEKHGG